MRALARHQIPADGLMSKSWDDMKDFNPDMVVTVCEGAAAEACPVWFSEAVKVHWGLADPSLETSDIDSVQAVFDQTINILKDRINRLITVLERQGEKAAIANAKESLT